MDKINIVYKDNVISTEEQIRAFDHIDYYVFNVSGGYEPALGSPDLNDKALVSNTAGVRSWKSFLSEITTHAGNHASGGIYPITPLSIGAEPALGNPATNNQVLVSSVNDKYTLPSSIK